MPVPVLRKAARRDADAIRALLQGCGLPTADLTASSVEFLVACAGSVVVGTGGLERCGASGLLRSVAVRADWRGSGLGGAIVARLEAHARKLALSELVLLTQTAVQFFARRGYRVIEREHAPAPVQSTAEFRLLCPQAAVCMLKALARDRTRVGAARGAVSRPAAPRRRSPPPRSRANTPRRRP